MPPNLINATMKTAIIVGATSGIGREVAISLVLEGWNVGLAGRRIELLNKLRDQYGHERVHVAAIDVSSSEACGALDALLAETGAPDLFLHVAGIGNQNKELDVEKEISIIRTNCEGMVRMVDHFVNYVRNNRELYRDKPARVAVVTSIAGTRGMGTAPAYSASKSMQSTYLSALSQLVRMEDIPVRFTDIRPGFVDTEILNSSKKYPMLMTRKQAACHILKGLSKQKRVVIFDGRYRLLVALWRLVPLWLWERMVRVTN